jgi:ABC-type branched-subunit amino acid transport system ATPase component/predicted MFS family arabinose efflux permease
MAEPSAERRKRPGALGRFGDAGAYPVLVLTFIYAVEQLDLQTFGVLAPEITSDLHTSATTIGLISIPQLLLAMVIVIVFGYFGDHVNRVALIVSALAIWAASTVGTAAASAVWILLVVRLVSASSRGANGVNTSMIADYYPTRMRGIAYGLYSSATLWGAGISAVFAGYAGEHWGWRVAFLAASVPGFVLVLFTLRLKDPPRGLREAQEAGESSAPPLRRLGPIRTARLLFNIRTVKWLALGAAIAFAGIAMAGSAFSFYFSAVFDVDPLIRGIITAAAIPFTMAGLFVGGLFGQRLLKQRRANLVLALTAVLYGTAAVGYVVLAAAPNLAVAVVTLVLAEALGAIATVPLNMLVASLVPANIRAQGFGVLAFCLLALTPISVPIGLTIGDHEGFRYALLAAAPLLLLAAVCIWIASLTAQHDADRAISITLAELEARQRRSRGEAVGILDVRNLDVAYGAVQALFGVDFHVEQGETVALLGTNGAGKSTLLRAISGLMAPLGGMVLLDGEDVSGTDAETLAHRGIVSVPGGKGIFPRLTVEQNLSLGAYTHWNDPEYVQRARADVLALFPRLGERLRQQAGTLSGGEQQMLNLAQGLMAQPRVLLIDELSLGLAPAIVQELLRVIDQLKARGISMVIVEQSVNIALLVADRAYFMEKGQIRFEGPSEELLGRTDLLRSIFLEGATRGPAAAPADAGETRR